MTGRLEESLRQIADARRSEQVPDGTVWTVRQVAWRAVGPGDDACYVELWDDMGTCDVLTLEEVLERAYADQRDMGGEGFADDWLATMGIRRDGDGSLPQPAYDEDFRFGIEDWADDGLLTAIWKTVDVEPVEGAVFLTRKSAEEWLERHGGDLWKPRVETARIPYPQDGDLGELIALMDGMKETEDGR